MAIQDAKTAAEAARKSLLKQVGGIKLIERTKLYKVNSGLSITEEAQFLYALQFQNKMIIKRTRYFSSKDDKKKNRNALVAAGAGLATGTAIALGLAIKKKNKKAAIKAEQELTEKIKSQKQEISGLTEKIRGQEQEISGLTNKIKDQTDQLQKLLEDPRSNPQTVTKGKEILSNIKKAQESEDYGEVAKQVGKLHEVLGLGKVQPYEPGKKWNC